MFKEIHPVLLKELRAYYGHRTRVELIKIDDPYTSLRPGDK